METDVERVLLGAGSDGFERRDEKPLYDETGMLQEHHSVSVILSLLCCMATGHRTL